MNVLVDTSVWVEHFRHSNTTLQSLLLSDTVSTHPLIVGELACGTPPAPRQQNLNYIKHLRMTSQVSITETLDFIERKKLYGRGCGLIDLTLLAATLITPECSLWTFDKRLAHLADEMNVLFHPPKGAR